MGYDVKRFADLGVLADDVICPICMCVFENPVITKCRHTYCKDCIKEWYHTNSTCPLDHQSIDFIEELVPAPIFVQNILGRLLITCDYQEHGCTQMVKLEDLSQHRLTCAFRPKPVAATFWDNVTKTVNRWFSPIRRRVERLDVEPRIQGRFNLRPRPGFDVLARRRREREEFERNEKIIKAIFLLFSLIAATSFISFLLRLAFDALEGIVLNHTSLIAFIAIIALLIEFSDFRPQDELNLHLEDM